MFCCVVVSVLNSFCFVYQPEKDAESVKRKVGVFLVQSLFPYLSDMKNLMIDRNFCVHTRSKIHILKCCIHTIKFLMKQKHSCPRRVNGESEFLTIITNTDRWNSSYRALLPCQIPGAINTSFLKSKSKTVR